MALRLVTRQRSPTQQQCRVSADGLACVRVSDRGRIPSYGELQGMLDAARVRASLVLIDLRDLSTFGPAARRFLSDAVRGVSVGKARTVLVRTSTQVDAFDGLNDRGPRVDVVELEAVEPPVQALLRLAGRERAARKAGHDDYV